MSEAAPGTRPLYLVGTPIGNLEDLSRRALRLIGEADLIAAEDTRTARRLLTACGFPAPKLVSYHRGNEAERSGELIAAAIAGKVVVVLSEAGMPGISDPGERVVRAAIEAGVAVEVVPGPVAAVTALVASGLPTAPFLFVGFLPRDPGPRRQALGKLRNEAATLLFYESPERVHATLCDMAEAFGEERQAALARELTKVHEEFVRGSLAELAERFAESAPRGECTLVVAGGDETEGRAIDPEDEMRELLRRGLSAKDAAARLVVKTGLPRRQLYQLALAIGRELAGDEPADD